MEGKVIEFDIDEVMKYIEPKLVIKKRRAGRGSKVYSVKFRRCTLQDFKNMDFEVPVDHQADYKARFCPDLDDYKE